jgi:hypothetical protein
MCNVAISERSQDMYAVLPDIVPAYPLHSLVYWFINVYHVFSFGETSALTKWLFEFTASWSLGSFDQKSRYSSAAATTNNNDNNNYYYHYHYHYHYHYDYDYYYYYYHDY